MRLLLKAWAVGALLTLSSCGTPKLQAIDETAIAAVQADITRQIGVYIAAARQERTIRVAMAADKNAPLIDTPVSSLKVPDYDPDKRVFSCGEGNITFDVSDVKAELVTTFDRTYGLSGSATIPIQIVTLGPSIDWKSIASNTQTLDYQAWPYKPDAQTNLAGYVATKEDIDSAPIAKVLLGLRSGLLQSSTRYDYMKFPPTLKPGPRPCFTDYNQDKPLDPPADTYKLGISYTYDTKLGLTVGVSVLSLGANGEWKSTSGNTLTVAFAQPGLEEIAKATTARDKVCDKDKNSRDCRHAKDEVENTRRRSGYPGTWSDKLPVRGPAAVLRQLPSADK